MIEIFLWMLVVTGLSFPRPATAQTPAPTADGPQRVDSLGELRPYVPQACAGARRCPLVVFLRGADTNPVWLQQQQSFSDTYGMILLVPPNLNRPLAAKASAIDTAVQQTLKHYAVDAEKIALLGVGTGGYMALHIGRTSAGVFRRVGVLSPLPTLQPNFYWNTLPWTNVDVRGSDTQFFLAGGLSEPNFVPRVFFIGEQLRRQGNAVTVALGLRGYQEAPEATAQFWRWLHASWDPGDATPPAPSVEVVPLTITALASVITFWRQFGREPDSIRVTGRRAHQTRVMVPVGTQRMMVEMMDLAAMAARYRSVAAALTTAKLTARQAEAYRVALIAAAATREVQAEAYHQAFLAASVAPGVTAEDFLDSLPALKRSMEKRNVEQQNVKFLATHRDQLRALWATGIWVMP